MKASQPTNLWLRDTGSFQEKDIDKAIHLLEKNNIKVARDVFLDVGSNIGTHTVHALKHGFRKALCVEADPDNFRLLKINQIPNDIDSHCLNICAAASNETGEVEIELSPTNYGDHRIAIKQKHDNNAQSDNSWIRKTIKKQTLDEMIKCNSLDVSEISFAWIDTQGHEGHVLSGARDFLASSTPLESARTMVNLSTQRRTAEPLNVIDEFTRECLAIRIDRKLETSRNLWANRF